MIAFTSSKTIKKYGKFKLLKMYRDLEFGMQIKLKNIGGTEGNIELTYSTSIMATGKVFRMGVVVVNDSVKLVNCNLPGFPQ